MSNIIMDESMIRDLPYAKRFETCFGILKNEKDESLRWDAVWLVGEIAEEVNRDDPLFAKVADLMSWVIKNDNNGVVKHEACFQIAARNMRNKIPDLIDAFLHSPSVLTKHEALEALGLMRATESTTLIENALKDPSHDVRETAEFVLKRFKRIKNTGEYVPSIHI